jgi:prepilin-type N-terminal cleavage/methylation domain-containing protein
MREQGFTLVEVLVALAITMIVMSAVFGLLTQGQDSFRREPEISDLQQSARTGLDRISSDLAMAGYKTPGPAAVLWNDGGGITPDEITIIYADESVPTSKPSKCGGGGTIDSSSTLYVEPTTLDPMLSDPEQSYAKGMILHAIELEDCNGDGQIGIIPFELTQPSKMTSACGQPTLNLNHNPGKGESSFNKPGGFNGQVDRDCATLGLYRVIQYRIYPLPPTPNPQLQRRDITQGEDWVPVSNNIENLQFQYVTVSNPTLVDEPPAVDGNNPMTWISRVKVTVAGRSESRNLEGASDGVFAAEDINIRKAFSTSVNLRNVSGEASAILDDPTWGGADDDDDDDDDEEEEGGG